MRSCSLAGAKTRRPRYHHGTQRTHRSTIQTGRSVHHRCCPRTQRGSGSVCGLLQCSSSPRGRCTSSLRSCKFLIFGVRASSTASWCGQQMVARTQQSPEPFSMQQTSQRAATVNKSRQKPFNIDGSVKSRKPSFRRRAAMRRAVLRNPSARTKWLLAGLMDRALSHWVRAPPLHGAQEQTPQQQMMTVKTLPLSPVNNPLPRSSQTSSRARSLMYQHVF